MQPAYHGGRDLTNRKRCATLGAVNPYTQKGEHRMKSLSKYAALALILLLGLALANPASAAFPRIIQQKTLVAKAQPQTWQSTDRGNVVYVNVYDRGGVIEQHWINGCRASYPDRANGLYVWVRLKECHRKGRHPFIVRYVSVSGPQRFMVRITTLGRD